MNRYINAGNLLTKIKAYRPYQYLGEDALSYAIKMVELEPSADVRENVRGEWISHDLENGEKSIDKDCCSVCGERFREIAMTGCEWNFCPNCGADMRGEQNRMIDRIMLSVCENGTYDITIHCESREEQEDVFKVLSAKRKVGVWRKESRADIYKFQCSECDEIAMRDWKTHKQKLTNFCPNCGADMRGE